MRPKDFYFGVYKTAGYLLCGISCGAGLALTSNGNYVTATVLSLVSAYAGVSTFLRSINHIKEIRLNKDLRKELYNSKKIHKNLNITLDRIISEQSKSYN